MKAQTFTTPFGTIEVTGREFAIVQLHTFSSLFDECKLKQSSTKDDKFHDTFELILKQYEDKIKELLIFLNTVE